MGIYVKGLLGAFSGKVGNVIGSNWRSIDYLRSLPKPSSKPATAKQKAQRAKFALAIEFLSPMREILNIGFNDKSQTKMTAFNNATNDLLFKIEGEYPDFTIPYPKVRFSTGSLREAMGVIGETVEGNPSINWKNSGGILEGLPTDVVYVILYHPEKDDFFVQTAPRGAQECPIDLEEMGTGEFHVWVLVISEDGTKRSKTRYLETITV